MHEMILCKLGEVVLKGLNRRSFEDKLMSNVNRRVSKCGNFRVYSKQSTIYVEPKDDECDIEAAFESCKKVFGIIAVSKALPCEKDIQKIISAAKNYLACEMRTARSFKVESKRADKTFPLTSIQISQPRPQAPSVGFSQLSSTKRISCSDVSMPSTFRLPRYRSTILTGAGFRTTWNW